MKKFKLIYVLGLLTLFAAACSNDDDPIVTPPTVENNISVTSNATLGNIMTDSLGMTLYLFSNDATGASVCSGGCLANWPVFYKDSLRIPATLLAKDFGTITRADGAKQTTYKSWPLYYYIGDTKAGDVTGDQVGGIWFVSKPDYTFMLAKKQLVGNDGISYDSTFAAATGTTQFLVDDWGRTLYAFAPDSFNVNKFTAADFSNNGFWPIHEGSTVGSVPSAIAKTDFASTNVYGKTQYTYKGWPLYYFGPDSLIRGNTKGVSVPQPGVWPVIKRSSPEAPKP